VESGLAEQALSGSARGDQRPARLKSLVRRLGLAPSVNRPSTVVHGLAPTRVKAAGARRAWSMSMVTVGRVGEYVGEASAVDGASPGRFFLAEPRTGNRGQLDCCGQGTATVPSR